MEKIQLPKIKNGRQMTIDNMTPDVKKWIKFVQEYFKKDFELFPDINYSWYILRFLRARDFDIKKTKKMLENALNFFDN